MGVNQVTGDYSRGASGFWIENGERSYPVSEVTIAGNLIDMFKRLTPANDLEFRFGTNAPTVRVEGPDRCWTLNSATSRGRAGRLARAVREAGALALQTFRGAIKTWTKGDRSPVSEADSPLTRCCAETASCTFHDYRWLSEETGDDPARLRRRDVSIVVDPIDGTRAYLAGLPDWAVSPRWSSGGRP